MAHKSRSRSRGARLPQDPVSAQIEDLAHDGRGIAHLDGKAVFIHGALPGEEVWFKYRARHSQYDEGYASEIVTAATERVTPHCAHFDICGGCALQHLDPTRQLHYKQGWLLDNLTRIGKVSPAEMLEPLTGPHWAYRHKARLGVKYVHKKGRVLVGFRERQNPFVADLQRCEVLHPKIGGLLIELGDLIQGLSIYNRLPQIEVAVGDSDVGLSFRVLDPPTEDDQAKLIAFGQRHEIRIYLQPKGPATTYALWPQAPDTLLRYALPDHDIELQFLPYHFTQVNLEMNRRMLDRAIALLQPRPSDRVLDLFCGLGNFSLPLARQVASVVGIEGEQSMVEWAERNATQNEITNVRFYAADLAAEELGTPTWLQQDYDKVLLDPPRSGALEMLPHIAALQPQRIVYVSCHPATLARDAGELVHRFGYRLLSAGVMDMFPHTAHVESIALFER